MHTRGRQVFICLQSFRPCLFQNKFAARCLYEVLRTHALKKTFHIATENGVLTFGSDEPKGEQRNDLLRLTKRVLEIDASTAQASQEQDRRMIMQEIDQVGPTAQTVVGTVVIVL